MLKSILLMTILLGGLLHHSHAVAKQVTLIAVLNSGQEMQTPKPSSNSLGNALLTYDTKTKMLCYAISYTDLVGTETAAHFHGPASAGENAGVVFPISPDVSALGSPKTGCVGPLTSKLQANLLGGLFYINVHSNQFGSGEIRGQVVQISGAKTRGQVAP